MLLKHNLTFGLWKLLKQKPLTWNRGTWSLMVEIMQHPSSRFLSCLGLLKYFNFKNWLSNLGFQLNCGGRSKLTLQMWLINSQEFIYFKTISRKHNIIYLNIIISMSIIYSRSIQWNLSYPVAIKIYVISLS